MRISDCSSDVRSSELLFLLWLFDLPKRAWLKLHAIDLDRRGKRNQPCFDVRLHEFRIAVGRTAIATAPRCVVGDGVALLQMLDVADRVSQPSFRSEEHTSELQSLMRISYAVFCLKKKHNHQHNK